MNDIRVRLFRDPTSEGVDVYVHMRNGTDRLALDPEGTWRPVDPSTRLTTRFAHLPHDYDLLQKLADALYEFGVIPHGYIPQRGEIEATEQHLDDMRAIVAKALDVKLPGLGGQLTIKRLET